MAISDKLNEKELEIGKVSLYVVSLKNLEYFVQALKFFKVLKHFETRSNQIPINIVGCLIAIWPARFSEYFCNLPSNIFAISVTWQCPNEKKKI